MKKDLPLMKPAKGFFVYKGAKAVPVITKVGNSVARKTGNWRIFTPKLTDKSKCVKCGICYLYCPESTISLDKEGYPVVDYEHCKGCLICVHECRPKAMEAGKE